MYPMLVRTYSALATPESPFIPAYQSAFAHQLIDLKTQDRLPLDLYLIFYKFFDWPATVHKLSVIFLLMRNPTYKTLCFTSQILASIIIITSVIVILRSLYDYELWNIEREAAKSLIITYYDFALYLVFINLIMGLYASCGITSGKKIFMTIYIKLDILMLLINSATVLYMYFYYPETIGMCIGTRAGQSPAFNSKITTKTGITSTSMSVLEIKKEISSVIIHFVYSELIVIAASLLLLFSFMYVIRIRLSFPSPLINPPVIDCSRQGLNTASLKKRRVVDMVV